MSRGSGIVFIVRSYLLFLLLFLMSACRGNIAHGPIEYELYSNLLDQRLDLNSHYHSQSEWTWE